jgi:hypothetical protein
MRSVANPCKLEDWLMPVLGASARKGVLVQVQSAAKRIACREKNYSIEIFADFSL